MSKTYPEQPKCDKAIRDASESEPAQMIGETGFFTVMRRDENATGLQGLLVCTAGDLENALASAWLYSHNNQLSHDLMEVSQWTPDGSLYLSLPAPEWER